MSKGLKSEDDSASIGQSWNNLSNKINNITLDCNPKNNVNIHEIHANINK